MFATLAVSIWLASALDSATRIDVRILSIQRLEDRDRLTLALQSNGNGVPKHVIDHVMFRTLFVAGHHRYLLQHDGKERWIVYGPNEPIFQPGPEIKYSHGAGYFLHDVDGSALLDGDECEVVPSTTFLFIGPTKATRKLYLISISGERFTFHGLKSR